MLIGFYIARKVNEMINNKKTKYLKYCVKTPTAVIIAGVVLIIGFFFFNKMIRIPQYNSYSISSVAYCEGKVSIYINDSEFDRMLVEQEIYVGNENDVIKVNVETIDLVGENQHKITLCENQLVDAYALSIVEVKVNELSMIEQLLFIE